MDCEWGEFGEWSTCTKTCAGGDQSRTRSVEVESELGGSPCTGNETETQSCNIQPCPGRNE